VTVKIQNPSLCTLHFSADSVSESRADTIESVIKWRTNIRQVLTTENCDSTLPDPTRPDPWMDPTRPDPTGVQLCYSPPVCLVENPHEPINLVADQLLQSPHED